MTYEENLRWRASMTDEQRRALRSEARRVYVQRIRELGFCREVQCGRDAMAGKAACAKCLARVARGQRKIDRRKAAVTGSGGAT
jgi:hypothetical protein